MATPQYHRLAVPSFSAGLRRQRQEDICVALLRFEAQHSERAQKLPMNHLQRRSS